MEALVIATEADFPATRPPCPECGASVIMSKGEMWLCMECGRKFSKILRGRKIADHGYKCPRCGGCHCAKNGSVRAICRDCGKSFRWPLKRGIA